MATKPVITEPPDSAGVALGAVTAVCPPPQAVRRDSASEEMLSRKKENMRRASKMFLANVPYYTPSQK